jgi:hypothetical protein
MRQLVNVRRWVRLVLVLGVVVSIVANVLHARHNLISQSIAAWAPLALLLTIELIARIPVQSRWLSAARLLATATIAGIAAWVSYWHMAGVALRYGEEPGAAHLIPFSVDGLIVVASICLVELGGRIRDTTEAARVTPGPAPAVAEQPPSAVPVRPVFLEPDGVPEPQGGDPAADTPADLELAGQEAYQDVRLKPEIETVVRAIKIANPDWGYQRIADAALTSKSNVGRILRTPRPPRLEQLNGHKPELEEERV